MIQNNPNVTETVGTVAETTTLFNGQAQTRTYSPEEAKQIQPNRTGQDPMVNWADVANKKILGRGE